MSKNSRSECSYTGRPAEAKDQPNTDGRDPAKTEMQGYSLMYEIHIVLRKVHTPMAESTGSPAYIQDVFY